MINPLHIPKGITTIFIALFGSFSLTAQPFAQSTPINFPSSLKNTLSEVLDPIIIGDKMPDIEFSMTNYPVKKAKISDFKGKLVILDFWATWCTACAINFAKMDSLQEKFKEKIQFILVNSKGTGDDEKKVNTFFEKWRKNRPRGLKLPSTVKDSIANILFPHKMVPHYVWITPDGKLMAETESGQVTEENIEKVLKGENIKLREKRDIMDFDYTKTFFSDGNERSIDKVVYRSQIFGYMDGLPGMSGINPREGKLVSRLYCVNLPIVMMYNLAIPETATFPTNRILLNVKDRSKYLYRNEDWDNWKYNNCYGYELIIPPTIRENAQKIVKADLDRFFNLETKLEKRKIKCWILIQINENAIPYADEGIAETNIREADQVRYFLHNQPIETLVFRLNEMSSRPVLNESRLDRKISLDLPSDYTNISILKKSLNNYGLDIIEAEREMDVFVISETSASVVSSLSGDGN